MMLRISLISLFGLMLCACSSSYDLGANVRPGQTLGNYQITTLEVVPADDSIAKDKDFHAIKPYLERELVQSFTNVGVGKPPMGLTVKISGISAEINAFTAAMVGDSYHITGRAIVWNQHRTNEVADVKVLSQTGPYGMGLIGVFNAASTDEKSEMAYRNEVASLFAREVRGAIYPEYDN